MAIAWSVAFAEVEEIDTINIYWAGVLAMRRAVEGLSKKPQHLLLDARRLKDVAIPQQAIVKGDCKSCSLLRLPPSSPRPRGMHSCTDWMGSILATDLRSTRVIPCVSISWRSTASAPRRFIVGRLRRSARSSVCHHCHRGRSRLKKLPLASSGIEVVHPQASPQLGTKWPAFCFANMHTFNTPQAAIDIEKLGRRLREEIGPLLRGPLPMMIALQILHLQRREVEQCSKK